MRTCVILLSAILLAPSILLAQETAAPKAEIFGGYSYLRNNNNGFRPASTLPCQNPQALPCGVCQGAKSRSSSRVGLLVRPNEVQARQVW